MMIKLSQKQTPYPESLAANSICRDTEPAAEVQLDPVASIELSARQSIEFDWYTYIFNNNYDSALVNNYGQ